MHRREGHPGPGPPMTNPPTSSMGVAWRWRHQNPTMIRSLSSAHAKEVGTDGRGVEVDHGAPRNKGAVAGARQSARLTGNRGRKSLDIESSSVPGRMPMLGTGKEMNVVLAMGGGSVGLRQHMGNAANVQAEPDINDLSQSVIPQTTSVSGDAPFVGTQYPHIAAQRKFVTLADQSEPVTPLSPACDDKLCYKPNLGASNPPGLIQKPLENNAEGAHQSQWFIGNGQKIDLAARNPKDKNVVCAILPRANVSDAVIVNPALLESRHKTLTGSDGSTVPLSSLDRSVSAGNFASVMGDQARTTAGSLAPSFYQSISVNSSKSFTTNTISAGGDAPNAPVGGQLGTGGGGQSDSGSTDQTDQSASTPEGGEARTPAVTQYSHPPLVSTMSDIIEGSVLTSQQSRSGASTDQSGLTGGSTQDREGGFASDLVIGRAEGSSGSSGKPMRRKKKRDRDKVKSYSVTDLSTLGVKPKVQMCGSGLATPTTPDNASRAASVFALVDTPSGPGTKETLAPAKRHSHSERRFLKLFNSVPPSEVLLSRFSCAYVGDMGLLVQGFLYVSYNWICFHSNIFGIAKVIELSVDSVAAVTKEKTAKIIPNAVGLRTELGKYYLFGSLLSRDNTYQLLLSVVSRKQSKDPSFYSLNNQTLSGDDQLDSSELPIDGTCSESTSLSSEEDCSELDSEDLEGYAGQLGGVHPSSNLLVGSEDSAPFFGRLTTIGGSVQAAAHGRTTGVSHQSKDYNSQYSITAAFTWFISLPKSMMLLLISVILLLFLFICASFLTIKLVNMHQSRMADAIKSGRNLKSSLTAGTYSAAESPYGNIPMESLLRIESAVDETLVLISETRRHLEALRVEVRASAVNTFPFSVQMQNLAASAAASGVGSAAGSVHSASSHGFHTEEL